MSEPPSPPPTRPRPPWLTSALRVLSLAWVPLAASALSLMLSIASIVWWRRAIQRWC